MLKNFHQRSKVVGDLDGGRRLDHDADGHVGVEGDAGGGKLAGRAGDERLRAGGSSTVQIMGNMTCTLPAMPARMSARNCALKNSGMASEMRIARQPRNGFASCGSAR